VLLGTRFLATEECPVPSFYKDVVVSSDGHDTILNSVSDTFSGLDWPGAWARMARTRFIEEWMGREPELRRRREEVRARVDQAWERGEPDYARLWIGQSAGLIGEVLPAGDVVRQIVADAEAIVRSQLPAMLPEG
jgi:nitronate monooxygenase